MKLKKDLITQIFSNRYRVKHNSYFIIKKFKLEITTLRKDVETDGRHAEVEYINDWKLDLKEGISQ